MNSTELGSILPKLLKVKANLEGVKKSSSNPFFKSKYADLNSHLDVVEPLLQEQGLVLLQPCSTTEVGSNVVSTMILDPETGQHVTSSMTLIGEKDMQKAGSAITYARRYTLGSLLGMKAEDDDGNGASGKSTGSKSYSKPSSKPAPPAKETKTETAPKASGFRKKKSTAPAPPASSDDGDDW